MIDGQWFIDIQSSFVLDNTVTIAFKNNGKTFATMVPIKGSNLYELIGSLESMKHQILKHMDEIK